MNSILMVTAVAGNIVGNAVFADMDSCMSARSQVVAQQDVTVSCVFTTKKKDNSKQMLGIMAGFMQAIVKAAEEETKNAK